MYIRLDKRKEETKAYGYQDPSSTALASTLCEYIRAGFKSTSALYQARSQVLQRSVPVAHRVTSQAFSQSRHYAWVHISTVSKRVHLHNKGCAQLKQSQVFQLIHACRHAFAAGRLRNCGRQATVPRTNLWPHIWLVHAPVIRPPALSLKLLRNAPMRTT